MHLDLYRTANRKTCEIGLLFADGVVGKLGYILENVIREVVGAPVESWKQQDGRNAIPAGKYQVVWNMSAHFQKMMPELLNVPGFAGVRIHAGNDDLDSEGCLICGSEITPDGEHVSGSGVLRDKLYDMINREITAGKEVWITIHPSAVATEIK